MIPYQMPNHGVSTRTKQLSSILAIIQRTNSRSVSELFDKCEFSEWQSICQFHNYHELIKTAIEIHIKYELDLQRMNLWKYAISKASKCRPDQKQFAEFEKIFMLNNVNPMEFLLALRKVLEKSENKMNTLRLVGLPNSCKTLISNCIVEPFITCRMNNHGSENEFYLSNMLNKAIIQCEELYITIATAEDFKSVLGGQFIDIAKKFNEKQLLSRTPVIITSNYSKFGRGHLSPVDENALSLRCFNFTMNSAYKPLLKLEWQQFYLYMMSLLYK